MSKELSTAVEPSHSSTKVEPMKGKKKPAKSKDLQAATKNTRKGAKARKGKGDWHEKYRPGTIGRMIADEIMAEKLDNKGILEKVLKEHKGAKTTYACVTWYRSKHNAATK